MLSLLRTDPTAARIARSRAVRLAQAARASRGGADRAALRQGARAWAHDARLHATGACRCLSCRRIDAAFHTLTGGY